jgi:hypothetical protein
MALTVNGFGIGSIKPENSEPIVAPHVGYWYWNSIWSDTVYYFLAQYEFSYHTRIPNLNTPVAEATVYLIAGAGSQASPTFIDGALATKIRQGTPVILGCAQATMTNIVSNPADGITRRLTPGEGLMRADFVENNVIISNLDNQESVYFIQVDSDIFMTTPGWMTPLVTVRDSDDFFIAGREMAARTGSLSDFRGTTVVGSGVYTTNEGVDISITAMAPNMFERASMHLYFRIMATALFAKASEIDIIDPDFVDLDFAELQVAIAAANALTQTHWTVASWNNLQTALTAAQSAIIATTQVQIDEATTVLNAAREALVRRPTGGTTGGNGGGEQQQPPPTQQIPPEQPPLVPGEDVTYRFNDVRSGQWFYDAVNFVYDESIMTGTSATTFEPNARLSRAMVATILYRLAGSPAITFENIFDDVNAGQWYSLPIVWAYQNDIVQGMGDGLFAPTTDITREQFAAMLHRFAEFRGDDVSSGELDSTFADIDQISSWAQEAMRWANYIGLMTGTPEGTLNPRGTATRAEAATILMRFMAD